MKKYNFSLVGFGRFGKVYFKEISQNKNINCSLIIKKKKTKKNFFYNRKVNFATISKKIPLNKIHAGIIATPVSEHYSNALLFLKKKIPIIIEKPVSNKLRDIKKLDLICKKNKTSVLVNYSDLYNEYFQFFLKKKQQIGEITKVKMIYENKLNFYRFDDPIVDFLPHFFAVTNKLLSIGSDFTLIKNEIYKKNGLIYQNLNFILKNKNNQTIELNYSNKSSKKKRQVIVYGTKGYFNFDGYENNKNFIKIRNKKFFINKTFKSKTNSPIQNILNKMCYSINSKIFYNDLTSTIKIQKITNNLINKL